MVAQAPQNPKLIAIGGRIRACPRGEKIEGRIFWPYSSTDSKGLQFGCLLEPLRRRPINGLVNSCLNSIFQDLGLDTIGHGFYKEASHFLPKNPGEEFISHWGLLKKQIGGNLFGKEFSGYFPKVLKILLWQNLGEHFGNPIPGNFHFWGKTSLNWKETLQIFSPCDFLPISFPHFWGQIRFGPREEGTTGRVSQQGGSKEGHSSLPQFSFYHFFSTPFFQFPFFKLFFFHLRSSIH